MWRSGHHPFHEMGEGVTGPFFPLQFVSNTSSLSFDNPAVCPAPGILPADFHPASPRQQED